MNITFYFFGYVVFHFFLTYWNVNANNETIIRIVMISMRAFCYAVASCCLLLYPFHPRRLSSCNAWLAALPLGCVP